MIDPMHGLSQRAPSRCVVVPARHTSGLGLACGRCVCWGTPRHLSLRRINHPAVVDDCYLHPLQRHQHVVVAVHSAAPAISGASGCVAHWRVHQGGSCQK
eukprot:1175756-Prorocentrum_minimum.AAC.6